MVLAVFFTSPQQKGAKRIDDWFASPFHEIHLSFCFFSTMADWSPFFLRDVTSGWISDHHGRRMWEDSGFLGKVNSLGFTL